MTRVIVQNEHQYPVEPALLKHAATTTCQHQGVPDDSEITIVLTTNEAVHTLNKSHRGVDAPTDVLSFPAEDLPPELAVHVAPYLGDLVIAYPYVVTQAEKLGHVLDDTLILLVIHGTLHLLGYDHDTTEHRAEMWGVQATILSKIGIDDRIVPALEEKPDDV